MLVPFVMQENVLLRHLERSNMSCEFDVKDVRKGTANCLCPSTLLTHLPPLSYASGADSLSDLMVMKAWPKSKSWKLSGHPETVVYLSDLTDGQVAWFEDETEFWIVQKSENLFFWYHLLMVVGRG